MLLELEIVADRYLAGWAIESVNHSILIVFYNLRLGCQTATGKSQGVIRNCHHVATLFTETWLTTFTRALVLAFQLQSTSLLTHSSVADCITLLGALLVLASPGAFLLAPVQGALLPAPGLALSMWTPEETPPGAGGTQLTAHSLTGVATHQLSATGCLTWWVEPRGGAGTTLTTAHMATQHLLTTLLLTSDHCSVTTIRCMTGDQCCMAAGCLLQ